MTVNGLTSNEIYFTITPSDVPPAVSSITPNVGSVEGGGMVTINGSGFTPDTEVYIGGDYPLNIEIVDTSTVEIKIPPYDEGPADVLVTNINGDAFIPDGFTYLAGPSQSILLINPPLGFINIPVNTNVLAIFTRPVDRATVTESSFAVIDNDTNTPVQGDISFEFGDTAILFKPLLPLSSNKTYRISITQEIKSVDAIPLDAPFTGFFTTGSAEDTVSPTVTTSPADNETVPYNASITFTFSEPMDPVTLNSYTITVVNNGEVRQGEITIAEGSTVATFIPYSPFLPDTIVNVTLSSKATDIAGNPIVGTSGIGTDLTFSFNTAANADYMPPMVLYINPVNGATGVNPNTSVSVTFTEPVNPVTVNSNSFLVSSDGVNHAGKILFSNRNKIATFIPDQTLPLFKQITVTLTTDITDISGNTMISAFTSTFTTQTGEDNFRPSIIKWNPYSGQGGVPLNPGPVVVFDERINRFSLTSSTLYLSGLEGRVPAVTELSADGLKAAITPSQPLLPNSRYYLYYTTGIRDIAGNPLLNAGYISFSTSRQLSDTTSPEVIEASPANGAAGIGTNAPVLIRFSESIAATSVDSSTIVLSKAGVPIDTAITLETSRTVARIIPANLYKLDPDTLYEIRVTTGVTDVAGNNLLTEFVSTFTTGSGEDNIAPAIVSVTPTGSNVSLDTNIVVVFSEPINPVTVNYYRSFYVTGDGMNGSIAGKLSISEDRRTVTFDPGYLLFAGKWYYIRLSYYSAIEDLSGNKLSPYGVNFKTGYSAGTDTNTFPLGATVVANPNRLYADGETTTTVTISNINRYGTLVPNGTKIGVSADKAFRLDSAGGEIIGGTTSISDPRFKIFDTLGGKVTFTYRSVNRSDLAPGVVYAYIQAASVDAAEVPVRLLAQTYVTLFRGHHTSISVNPRNLLANGTSISEVNIVTYDRWSEPVPAGQRLGVTAEPVYFLNSAGGTINGGDAALDDRFRIFNTITGGLVYLTYTGPSLEAGQSATAYIQTVNVDDMGQVTGQLGYTYIYLNGSSGYTGPQPKVIRYSPFNGQSNAGLNAPIVAEFSQSLNPSTVTSSNFSISGPSGYVSGTRTLSNGVRGPDTIVTFVPDNPWAPNSVYYVYIGTGIRSVQGNPLLSYVNTNFSTGIADDTNAPSVVMVNPEDGGNAVATNNYVTIRFNEPMNPVSINTDTFKVSTDGTYISGRVTRNSYKDYRFIPDNLLEPDTVYTVTVTTGVKDTSGNNMADIFTSGFTTGTGTDNLKPNVVSVDPANGSTNVPSTTSVTITFSEPMNPLTINSSACYISGVRSSIILSGGNTVATITPVNPLFAGTQYYIYITTKAKDRAGNSTPNTVSYYFNTAIAPGANLPTGANITINPPELFANGNISSAVIIENININGTPTPNGTIIGVTVEPAFISYSAGGMLSGSSIGTSVDNRFLLFETLGASVTLTYTPPDLDWLSPGSTASGIIQVASVDLDTWPVRLISQRTATLFRIKNASITADPATLPADGVSQSTIDVIVRDKLGNLVPDGTRIGLTTANIYTGNSAGGTIIGGIMSSADSRVQIFTTAAGQISAIYQSPDSPGSGNGIIQILSVDNNDRVTGFVRSINISLTNP